MSDEKKYMLITVPRDVALMNLGTGKPVTENGEPVVKSFRQYALEVWANNVRFIKEGGRTATLRWDELIVEPMLALPEVYIPGTKLKLRIDAYRQLKDIVQDSPPTMLPMFDRQIKSFYDAVLDAVEAEKVTAAEASANGAAADPAS